MGINISITKKNKLSETSLYENIRELIVTSRQTVARGVELVQVLTNFEIGRHIIEHEQQGKGRAAYGKEVLNRLSEKLTGEFGKGFSRSNLEYMRRFYMVYSSRCNISQKSSGKLPINEKSQTKSGESGLTDTAKMFSLSWSHYAFLLGIKNNEELQQKLIEWTESKTIS